MQHRPSARRPPDGLPNARGTRVLVTGGAGFIGARVAEALVEAHAEVVVLDDLRPAVHPEQPAAHPAATLVRASLNDTDAVERALRGVDVVCHEAAKVGLGVDMGDIREYVEDNDLGTASLLLAMHRARYRGRLVLASSMVVYGEGRYRCERHGVVPPGPRTPERLARGDFEPPCPRCHGRLVPEAVPEVARPDPRSVYAATKLHQEHLCAVFAREHGIPSVALRYHNVYGPRMPRDTPYAGVASIFRSALARGEPPAVFEDGGQLRDFVHVSDVARANVLAVTADPSASGAFNIASGLPRTVGEMARALSEAFDGGSIRPVVTGRVRQGDVRHVFASTERAARMLGFRALIPFDEGMRAFATAPLRGDREVGMVV
jgi:dTDP-L-rhamnose 4-epimerase